MKIGPKLVTIIKRMKFFAQGFSRAGVYHSISNGQIWADAVGGKFSVSLKAMAKSFGFTQIIMQEYVHKIARPVVLSDTFFYINACSQMVCAAIIELIYRIHAKFAKCNPTLE